MTVAHLGTLASWTWEQGLAKMRISQEWWSLQGRNDLFLHWNFHCKESSQSQTRISSQYIFMHGRSYSSIKAAMHEAFPAAPNRDLVHLNAKTWPISDESALVIIAHPNGSTIWEQEHEPDHTSELDQVCTRWSVEQQHLLSARKDQVNASTICPCMKQSNMHDHAGLSMSAAKPD